jgi:Domain of unknown function (DUF4157)
MRMHSHDNELGADRPAVHRPPERGRDHDHEAARRAVAQRSPTGLGGEAMLHLQRMAGNAGVQELLENEEPRSSVLDVVGRGGGEPLAAGTREVMEDHLGADLSDVRVHTGDEAAESARSVSASAYTVGNEIVFNEGAYQPATDQGQRALAHELTHVVQQRSGPVDGTPTGDGIALSDPADRFEREASANADAFASGAREAAASPATATVGAQRMEIEEGAEAPDVQRQEPEEEEEEGEMPA